MSKTKMKLKIGDIVYKKIVLQGFALYKVTAIIKRERATLYEVECQSCSHSGNKCVLLIANVNKHDYDSDKLLPSGVFKYVDMVNDYGDNSEFHHNNHCGEKHYFFFVSKEEALLEQYIFCIREKSKEIEKHASIIDKLKRELLELEDHRNNIELSLKKQ